jgi:hypothetical protein
MPADVEIGVVVAASGNVPFKGALHVVINDGDELSVVVLGMDRSRRSLKPVRR